MEEVATMEIYTIQRPSLLPAAVCAPSATWLPITAAAPAQAPAAVRASAQTVHQVQAQAELAQVLVDGGAVYGFKGINVLSAKRMTDGGSGTPPRGRPV
jgi:hypothetical protein